MDILSIFRQYGVPFNDPCNPEYIGVCHCDSTFVENVLTQSILNVCTNSFPAGTSLANILQNICGTGGADDDWRFVSGSSFSDPLYRTGFTSIGTTASTHQLRVDGLFQFNPDTGWTFDFDSLFRMSFDTGATLSLGSKNTPGTRTLLGDLIFQGRFNGQYYTGASITGQAVNPWTLSNRDSSIEFKVVLANTTNLSTTMTLQSDSRLRLNRYTFNDGIPTVLLGLNNTVVSRHPVTGSPVEGSVLGVSGGSLSYINPAASVVSVENGISKDVDSDIILGGLIDRDTYIQNNAHDFVIGQKQSLADESYIYQSLSRIDLFVRQQTQDRETELNLQGNYAALGFDRGAISARIDFAENSSTWLFQDGTPIGFLLTPGRIVIQGLPTYSSTVLAQADATLPPNALFKVNGDNNLKIKI